jgi:hypothetical protein
MTLESLKKMTVEGFIVNLTDVINLEHQATERWQ